MKATVNSAVSIIRAALIAAATAALLPSFSAAAADGAGQAPQKRPWSIYKQSGETYSYIRADGRANAVFRFLKDGESWESAAAELSKAKGCSALSSLSGMCVSASEADIKSFYRVSDAGGRNAIEILTFRGLTEKEAGAELDSAEKILLGDTQEAPKPGAPADDGKGGETKD